MGAEFNIHVPSVLAVVSCNNDGDVAWSQISVGGKAGDKNIKTLIQLLHREVKGLMSSRPA